MAQRGILLRLFVHDSSLRFGLPGTDADWLRLEQALTAWKQTS
jgi:cobalamin biosynthesis protein CobC